MSSSIPIPAPPPSVMGIERRQLSQSDNAGGSSPPGSSYSTSPEPSHPSSSPASSTMKKTLLHARRPSLLSSAISKQECTTINIAEDKDGPPELPRLRMEPRDLSTILCRLRLHPPREPERSDP
ncbi:hypothetical protein GE21DRAFT_10455 [Neurospora crassa]|uniref:Uncharacterized protein n=1 Tax=Neurospora crassa (strain ATCC 24698 / 74-OR23-1A / CBS 708.71 / DSM 1257 / FGSC 987) TaxID=367110 RepID=Q7S5A4_NEUCR|nr:hypothetical protein NCU02261 [Neurospora crassa OR74A]EAA30669.2 hypothetical protein NCU02261 [Neurospora crassa OR74A]KHE84870.1 hypothetical protein GE21DRAFT_10455 [Neurospora crassa]|eukprot:XP_959905.2 hypothetical protein NCU02261 [Neurospora crassa OR74A]